MRLGLEEGVMVVVVGGQSSVIRVIPHSPDLQVKAHYQISWRKSGPAYEEDMLLNDLSWDIRNRVSFLHSTPLYHCCS